MQGLGKSETAERNREIGQRNLADLQALQETLTALGHGTVTLHYLVLEDRTHIILTTPMVQLVRESKIGSAQLNQKIQAFRQALQRPWSDPLPLAQELHHILIGPIADDLRQAQAQTLMVSLDGALRYLPFAALHDGKRYLIESHALAIYTEASKDRLRDKPTDAWRFSGLGVTRKIEGFSPLPAVREELEGIVKGGILPGELFFDEQFNLEQFRATLDKRSPSLHIASHFVFQPGTEADSFLLLGDGSRLSLTELKRLRFRDVDLITLSACETAVGGGKDNNGREIESFGALAQRQGAKGVLATLWPVADQSTGQLMRNFYRVREQEKMTKADALQQVQLQFIRSAAQDPGAVAGAQRTLKPGSLTPSEPIHDYSHPFYWAPFILMGNWL
jgi:CHAT domain-containing protein